MKHIVASDEDIQRLKENQPWIFMVDGESVIVLHKDSLRFIDGVPSVASHVDESRKKFVCGIDECKYEQKQPIGKEEQYLKLHQSRAHGVRGINWQRKHGRTNGARRTK
jgi:hypothetical protein